MLGKLRCDLRRETVATRLLVLSELRCGLRRKAVATRLLVLRKLRCGLRRKTVATRLLVLGELRCGLRRKTVATHRSVGRRVLPLHRRWQLVQPDPGWRGRQYRRCLVDRRCE